MDNIIIEGKFWLKNNKNICISDGKIELLKKVSSEGSISKAARDMHMSYKAAWDMVEEINDFTSDILIEKNRGGKNGGGCTLTSEGKAFLEKYKDISKKYHNFISEINRKSEKVNDEK